MSRTGSNLHNRLPIHWRTSGFYGNGDRGISSSNSVTKLTVLISSPSIDRAIGRQRKRIAITINCLHYFFIFQYKISTSDRHILPTCNRTNRWRNISYGWFSMWRHEDNITKITRPSSSLGC